MDGEVHEIEIPLSVASAIIMTSDMSGPAEEADAAGAGVGDADAPIDGAKAGAVSTGGLANPTERDIASMFGSTSTAVPSAGA